jgi:DNA-binding NtrC family response regulator
VGGKNPVRIDVRVICATAKDLAAEVQKGKFRQDLFYRLQVIPIEVPPLRQREGDILELADFFLKEFGGERGLSFQLSADARQALEQYHYPGNVRELRNLLERISVLAPAPRIQLWDLPVEIRGGHNGGDSQEDNLAAAVAEAERKCIQRVLAKTGDNKTEAAVILGISRKNLWEKMKQHGL